MIQEMRPYHHERKTRPTVCRVSENIRCVRKAIVCGWITFLMFEVFTFFSQAFLWISRNIMFPN